MKDGKRSECGEGQVDCHTITICDHNNIKRYSSNVPTSGWYGVGEMWVETDTQDIYIRTN